MNFQQLMTLIVFLMCRELVVARTFLVSNPQCAAPKKKKRIILSYITHQLLDLWDTLTKFKKLIRITPDVTVFVSRFKAQDWQDET